MSYYRRRGRGYYSYPVRRGSEQARAHVLQALSLQRKYGTALTLIQETFFGLDGLRLERLLVSYRLRYGSSAESYARKTIPKWKSGEVRASGQTLERLLDLLPEVMTTQDKLRFVKYLREQTIAKLPKERVDVTLHSEHGMQVAFDRALAMVKQASRIQIGSQFTEIAHWLDGPEAQSLDAFAREIEAQVNLVRMADLIVHLGHLFQLQAELPAGSTIAVTVEMPTATANIRLVKSRGAHGMRAASNEPEDDTLVKLQRAAIEYEHLDGRMNFMDYVLRTLSPEEQRRAREMALKEGVELQALIYRIRAQTEEGKHSIAETMKAAKEMNERGLRGTISSQITTGAGSTKIEIHTDRSPMYTALLVAGGVVIVFGGAALLWLANSVGMFRH